MKQTVDYVRASHGYSERRACKLTRQPLSTQRKPATRDPQDVSTSLRLRSQESVEPVSLFRAETHRLRTAKRASPTLSELPEAIRHSGCGRHARC